VLDCTWNDVEAEIVLRNLGVSDDEQQKLHSYYLKLREEYRKATQSPASTDAAPALDQQSQ
jgi:hypothetical protein